MNELELNKSLLEAAITLTKEPGWNGPRGDREQVLACVSGFSGSSIGSDWRDFVPDEVSDLWKALPQSAQLVAFIAAADRCLGHAASLE
jgi:hypothetical protein